MTSFRDHFSRQAHTYARFRPHYPRALFAYLASLAPGRRLAWDCGTGNGQAALALAEYFERVVATDASAEQIAYAPPHARVEYRVERAEDVRLPAGSVDLVTAAVAVHWFDFDRFYATVRQALAPGGVLAVWTYHLPAIAPEIDRVLARYEVDVLAGYWPERLRYLVEHYRTLPFPFEELEAPEFTLEADWDLPQLLGFLDSWSATRRYEEAQGRHPLAQVWPELAQAWGAPERKRAIRWPLYMRVGRPGLP